jgi:hypothetical protein
MSATEHSRHSGAAGDSVAERAEACLRTSPYKVLGSVKCNHQCGKLTLEGRVPSYYHKQLAQVAVSELAAQCDDVQEVVNQIEVTQ